MDISKISAAIEQIGYNPYGLQGTNQEEIEKFAQKNGISIEEAKNILSEAEEKAEENNKIASQEAALMAELLNTPDEEEEIQIIDDFDFDNFLNEENPEQKIQNIFAQQQFLKQDNTQNQNNSGNNPFSQEDNPFLKMKWSI